MKRISLLAKVSALLGVAIMVSSCVSIGKTQKRDKDVEYPETLHTLDLETGPQHYAIRQTTASEKAPLLFFVHGSPGTWDGFSGYLRSDSLASSYEMISVDRPGFGESRGGKPERSLIVQSESILEVVKKHKGDRPVILVGHSFGGPVIAQIAILAPELIDGLVFVAASVDPDLEKKKWFQVPANWFLFRWMVPQGLDVANQEILALKKELIRMEKDWDKIKTPVSIVHGDKDKLVPIGNVDFMTAHLEHTSVELFLKEGMNHFVPWNNPQLLLAGIQSVAERIADRDNN